jgi:hypothetical protein
MAATDATVDTARHEDGPDEAEGYFWWDGKRYGRLPPTSWRLVSFLWMKDGRRAEFAELSVPVWKDPAVLPRSNDVKNHAQKIRQFFHENAIPLTCTQGKPYVAIVATDARKVVASIG